MEYRVVAPYRDAPAKPIRLKSGQAVEILDASDPEGPWPNWILCRGGGGEGWVPVQIVERRSGSEGRVREDYTAREHELEEGDLLAGDRELNGWVWCVKLGAKNEYAWAPLDHLERADD